MLTFKKSAAQKLEFQYFVLIIKDIQSRSFMFDYWQNSH